MSRRQHGWYRLPSGLPYYGEIRPGVEPCDPPTPSETGEDGVAAGDSGSEVGSDVLVDEQAPQADHGVTVPSSGDIEILDEDVDSVDRVVGDAPDGTPARKRTAKGAGAE